MSAQAETNLDVDFLSAIIEHVAHPIFVKDREFRFVLLNRALCEMVGYPRHEMLGKTDYDFFPRSQADFFRQKDIEMFESGSTVTVDEEPITDAEGNTHILETIKVPYRAAGGEVTHLVGIIHDITRIKLAEETLQSAKDELERRVAERTRELGEAQDELLRRERLSVLGHLSGGLAHQLRNPLGAMQNAVAILRREALGAAGSRALDVIVEEVRRANKIITGLLDYARVRPPAPREVPLAATVADVLSHVSVPDNVSVKLEVCDELMVRIDPLQFQQAFANLIDNALEAMPEGGELTVETREAEGELTLVVRDSGEGVPESARGRLFQPLVTTKPLGLGLGLSTARSLIEAQGGELRYSPGDPKGSEFIVVLPAA